MKKPLVSPFVLVIGLCLSAFGCGPRVDSSSLFDNSPLATPCIMENQQVSVIVRDYFPLLPQEDTISLVMGKDEPFLDVKEIVSGRDKASLIIENRTPAKMRSARSELAPFISTSPVEGSTREFYLEIDNGADIVYVLWQNTLIEKCVHRVDPTRLRIEVPSNAHRLKRSYIRVYAANGYGISNDVLVPLERGRIITDASTLNRTDFRSQVIYSLMIDRFVNGDKSNDRPLNSPLVNHKVDYWGGDLAGVTDVLESGYFDSLGVTTLWLSPVSQNPFDAWGQIYNPVTKFSGYHGYWPYYATAVDVRYGTDEQLRELLDKAHDDGKNVILDYVSNHMHIQSPTLTAHPDWTTPSLTPDGRPNRQLYDEFRLTTWFDDHIPTLDLERADICAQLTDSALFWLQHYDFDGFRHDATKHVPEQYWRMLTRKILDSISRPVYQIGETYGSRSLIASYVKPGMQDAQFDFNVYDTFLWATTQEEGSFEGLSDCIAGDLAIYGYHNLMGNITGNHDRTRYICLASGDVRSDEDQKLAGWTRNISVSDPVGYDKLKMLHALNFTLPGIPVINYGDEYGQPGANDPDNRRWMRFDDLNDREKDVLDCVKELSALRSSSMPLLFGDYCPLYADKDVISYMRIYMGRFNIIFISDSDEEQDISVTLPLGLIYNGANEFVTTVAPHSFKILSF